MKIREIASGLQFPEGPVALADGSVLVVEIARGTLSRVTMDGRIHVGAALGGGPNGAAIGPDGAVYVCNSGGFRWATEIYTEEYTLSLHDALPISGRRLGARRRNRARHAQPRDDGRPHPRGEIGRAHV